jgi:hypothetical protein
MGPLYAFHTARERTQVKALKPGKAKARFAIFNDLDPKIYIGSVTLEFTAPANTAVRVNGQLLQAREGGMTDRWTEQYFRREGNKVYLTVRPNQVVEFR